MTTVKIQHRMQKPTSEEISTLTQKYDHAKNIYLDWTQISSGITISSEVYYQALQVHPCLQTKLLVSAFIVPDSVLQHSTLSFTPNMPTKPHPLKINKNPYTPPSSFSGEFVCYEKFKCGHPSCVEHPGSCTFQFKWAISPQNLYTISFYVKGSHSQLFEATSKYFKTPHFIRNQVLDHFDNRGKPLVIANSLMQKYGNTNNPGYLPSAEQLRNVKYYHKKKKRTHEDQFVAFKKALLSAHESKSLLLFTPKDAFEQATHNNFLLAVTSVALLDLGKQAACRVCGFDGVFKLCTDKYPIYILTTVLKNFQCVPLAFFIMETNTSEHLATGLKWFQELLLQQYNIDWNPLIMIDDGAAERSACIQANLTYILCWFHVKKAMLKRIRSDIDAGKAIFIFSIIDKMACAKNEATYNKYYLELRNATYKQYPSFLNYFINTWHFQYPHWTMIIRYSSDGLDNTNNYTERSIKELEAVYGKHGCIRMDDLVDAIIGFIGHKLILLRQVPRKCKTVVQMQENLVLAKQMTIDWSKLCCNAEYTQFSVPSSNPLNEVTYTVCLVQETCECLSYYTTHHVCKHLYFCMLQYCKKHVLEDEQLLSDPIFLKQTIHKHIHDPNSVFIVDTNKVALQKQTKPVQPQLSGTEYYAVSRQHRANLLKNKEQQQTAQQQAQQAEQDAQEQEFIVEYVNFVSKKGKQYFMNCFWKGHKHPSLTEVQFDVTAFCIFEAVVMSQLPAFYQFLFHPQVAADVASIVLSNNIVHVLYSNSEQPEPLAACNIGKVVAFWKDLKSTQKITSN